MNYLDLLSPDGKSGKIQLTYPASRKTLHLDMSMLDEELNGTTRTIQSGKDYVQEYVKKDEQELLEAAKLYVNEQNQFDDVSQGTSLPVQEIINSKQEDAEKIYKTFNFAYRPKPNLAITSMKDRIVSMIETNSVVVIQGPTGCGKTTQVPQFIIDSCCKKRVHCNIIVTSPRRIAAMSIAKRVSFERDWPVGTFVGFQVGLINNTSKDTRLTYCTTGVLLHKLINAKNMLDYTHVILDEVHERDQDMDFLLLVVRKLLRTNSRGVKVILMSATFEVQKFSKYFSSPVGNILTPAPVIDVAKKNYYNVAVYYLCQLESLGTLPDVCSIEPNVSKKMMEFCVNLVIVLDDLDLKADDADLDAETGIYERHVILIFLPGIHEIEDMHGLLQLSKHEAHKWDIVVLHSSITNEEQQRIFQKPPKGHRRIILSTNIAESSITVPDVKYVIDFCLTKQLVTETKTNFQCLELIWASKTNCEQRAGRTGRVMDGRVYRLVPKLFFDNVLARECSPEILRAPLENIVLKAKILDMGEPKAILALSLDPPDLGNLERTILLLKECGAFVNRTDVIEPLDGELTDLGRVMANLPLEIHVTKLIMLGHVFSVFKDAIIIAASMAVKDMFSNPFQRKLLAYKIKLTWGGDSYSDCIAFMNVYNVWMTEKANRRLNTDAAEKNWAYRNFVQIRVLREVRALVIELTNRLEKMGIRETAGSNKVVWGDHEKGFVLKIAIAGAFYPNYFSKRILDELDERAGIKLLGGLDPFNTVYVQGWPLKQPGPLYARRIQNAFKDCLSTSVGKVKVTFDNSSRVCVQFTDNEPSGKHCKESSKKISLSVYKAIRMRQCDIGIEIPLLNEDAALRRAEGLNLLRNPLITCARQLERNVALKSSFIKPQLPGLRVSRIPLLIQHAIDPGHFWIQLRNAEVKKHVDQIRLFLDNVKDSLKELVSVPDVGTLVIAPYEDKSCRIYLRATVQSYITETEIFANVYYIDHGYTMQVRLSDLRQLEDEKLAAIPALAIECVLANVRPNVVHTFINDWSEVAYNSFWNATNQPGMLFGDIYSVVNSVVSLYLIHVNDEKQLNINKFLIDKDFAIEKEEDYFSRFNHSLREKHEDMTDEQCCHYEKMQYDETYMSDVYVEPPDLNECFSSTRLKGPYSPLEIELYPLTLAGKSKKVKISSSSVNSVLLDTDPEDTHARLMVAGSVSQSSHNQNLTIYNTTLLPNVPGLMSLMALIFSPQMELRCNSFGTYYVGALCGLGYHPDTNASLFPEHDIELLFDVEITVDDLLYINRLRHWINIGLQSFDQSDGCDNMQEIITCQTRIKDALLKLIEKKRKPQVPEFLSKFHRWNRYDESLLLRPFREPMLRNYVYKLHNALDLMESNAMQSHVEHLKHLRKLAAEDPRTPGNTNIPCNFCDVVLADIFDLRGHLFSRSHQQNEEKLGVQVD